MYLVSILVVLAAVVLLGVVAFRLAGPARRLAVVRSAAVEDIDDRVRMLVARVAALRVRLAQRRA